LVTELAKTARMYRNSLQFNLLTYLLTYLVSELAGKAGMYRNSLQFNSRTF